MSFEIIEPEYKHSNNEYYHNRIHINFTNFNGIQLDNPIVKETIKDIPVSYIKSTIDSLSISLVFTLTGNLPEISKTILTKLLNHKLCQELLVVYGLYKDLYSDSSYGSSKYYLNFLVFNLLNTVLYNEPDKIFKPITHTNYRLSHSINTTDKSIINNNLYLFHYNSFNYENNIDKIKEFMLASVCKNDPLITYADIEQCVKIIYCSI